MRTFMGIMLTVIFNTCGFAQEVEFTASATPDVLHVGEQFNLIYSSNHQISDLDLPEIREFEFLGGPSQGHSQSISSVNGKITRTSTYQYTYFFRALKEGEFTIPAATAKIGNREYQANPVSIEVVPAQTTPSSRQNQPDGNDTEQPEEIDDNSLFIRFMVDKTEAYIGEQIAVTIKLYSKVNLSGVDQAFKGPDFTGFFIEPVEVMPLRSLEREVYNGDIYGTGILRQMVIIPQHSGDITIGSFDVDVSVRQEVRRRITDSFFDDFFFPDVQNVPYTLSSGPVRISVKPLPDDAPDSFAGAVGNFRLSSSISGTETMTNEPLTLKYMISGTGNLKLMDELTVDIPAGLERYDPVISTNLDNARSGTKTYEYLIIPHNAGIYSIPPAEFTYFDPASREYRTLYSQSYTVNVRKGEWDSLSHAVSGVYKEDVQLLNEDIHYIKTRSIRLSDKDSYFAGSWLFYILSGAVLIMFIVLLTVRNRLKAYNADVVQVRKRRADKYALKRLKHCGGLIEQGKHTEFYDVLLVALWRYLSDKLNIPLSGLSRETAMEQLKIRSIEEELIREFFRITGECEVARYTPVAEHTDIKQIYQDALDVISKIQQKLK
ncbi:MAG: protein BatD [Bacteroidales bacterium]|nr:protein BatD [Bacteroidales bacterium]